MTYIMTYSLEHVTLYFHIPFGTSFLLFFIEKFPQQNIDQSESRICDKELSVELYVNMKSLSLW